jgi:hypothetical protein
MNIHETDVEMARRHVAEAQRRLHRQRVLVTSLAELGHDTEVATQTLAAFEATLQIMREHLALEEWLAPSSAGTALQRAPLARRLRQACHRRARRPVQKN